MSNEENLQAHDVNISKHEDVTEDIPMEETSSDESITEDESVLSHVLIVWNINPSMHQEECPTRHVGIFDVTLRGSKYWIPDVEDKPVKEGRKARKPIVKEMNPNNEKKQQRRRSSCHIGCQDKLVIKLINGNQFVVDKYKTDENDALMGLFWADEEAKRNYLYNMVLVPFTGIDNHNRCVTFGVGLIARETAKSYKWLLKSFKQAFRRAPKVFVTDQDVAYNEEINIKAICSNNSFKRQICNIVWTNNISPEVFEEKWASIMTDFNLHENKWLYDMYQMRDKWIPACLRDEPMAGLMRTSSRLLWNPKDVQDEIYASLDSCHSVNVTQIDDMKKFVIHDLVDDVISNHVSDVEENEINYEDDEINEFPKKYLLRRWSRDAFPPISEESLNKMREYNNVDPT
ncbi:FAR1-related sequence 5-like protein [Tanacetum coccineum]|uniref:FAR1-related sequence 5-like protein n=1 Tax=Tanacetum coccineum TaxID=301880 RepID=A0ABQ4Z6A5_9ASTR